MRKLLITLLLLIVLCVGVVGADSPSAPLLPAQYYGTAFTANGGDVPPGTVITAELDGVLYTYTMTSSGKIGEAGTFGNKFIISPPGSSPEGKTITFKVGSVLAPQTSTFSYGTSARLALTFGIDVTSPDTTTGKNLASQSSVIITNNSVPAGFLLPITDVPAAQQPNLPPVPSGSSVFKLVDITPVNPPAGPYTIIYTFTLTAADLNDLKTTKDKIVVLHHNEATNTWETVPIYIKIENIDGSVTYDAWLSSFSAFMIASSPTGSTAPFTPGGSTGGPVTNVPTTSVTAPVTPIQTPNTIQTQAPTTVATQPGAGGVQVTPSAPLTEGTDSGLVTILFVVIGVLTAIILIIGAVWLIGKRKNRNYL